MISVIASCTKKPVAKTTSPNYLSASSSTIGSFYCSGASVSAGGASGAKLEIDASAASGRRMVLFLNPYTATTGYIAITGGTYVGGQYSSAANDTVVMSAHGNITLTSVSPNVIGTFNYTGTDSMVYSGSFNVPAP